MTCCAATAAAPRLGFFETERICRATKCPEGRVRCRQCLLGGLAREPLRQPAPDPPHHLHIDVEKDFGAVRRRPSEQGLGQEAVGNTSPERIEERQLRRRPSLPHDGVGLGLDRSVEYLSVEVGARLFREHTAKVGGVVHVRLVERAAHVPRPLPGLARCPTSSSGDPVVPSSQRAGPAYRQALRPPRRLCRPWW